MNPILNIWTGRQRSPSLSCTDYWYKLEQYEGGNEVVSDSFLIQQEEAECQVLQMVDPAANENIEVWGKKYKQSQAENHS